MRGFAAGLLCIAVAACAAPTATPSNAGGPAPTPAATTSPAISSTAASVLIECLDATYPTPLPSAPTGYVGGKFCTKAWPVVLAAIAGQGGVPTTVVFDMGQYCRTSDPLALPTACPGGGVEPSDVNQPAGHALVSFAGTHRQAYVDLWLDGTAVTADLIAVMAPLPSPTPS